MAATVEAARATAPRVTSRTRRPGRTQPVRISVVIPTRNEAGNVEELERQLDSALVGVDYEVVVVDDSNDDVTRPALRAASITALMDRVPSTPLMAPSIKAMTSRCTGTSPISPSP